MRRGQEPPLRIAFRQPRTETMQHRMRALFPRLHLSPSLLARPISPPLEQPPRLARSTSIYLYLPYVSLLTGGPL